MPPSPHPAPVPSPGVTRRLYGLLTPYRRTVALGLLLLVGSVAAELYPPLVWIRVVDQGIPARDWTFIGWHLALLVAVFGVQQLLSAWRGLLLERAGQQLTLDLQDPLPSVPPTLTDYRLDLAAEVDRWHGVRTAAELVPQEA